MKKIYAVSDFYVGLSGKSKLIIFLLSSGDYTYEKLRTLTVSGLLSLRKYVSKNAPELLDVVDELTDDRTGDEAAFQYRAGRAYSSKDIQDILVRAHEKKGIEYKGLKHFQEKLI